MTLLLHSLVRLLTRIVIALVVALLAAVLLALAREGTGFASNFGIACLVVGCLALLMAPAGSSPAMRAGTIDTWTASFFPKLIPGMAEEYSKTSVSSTALFAVTGIALLVLGAFLAG